jgi:hypothetical protein
MPPHYTAQALCARGKRSVVLPHALEFRSIVAGRTWCATRTASAAAARTAKTAMHRPTHRRVRQALRRQRCTARPLFTRPAWPRRALRSHDYQSAPRKLSAHAVASCSPCAYHVPHYTAWRYARRPRRTLRSHDRQRASGKLSVHAVDFCASSPPLYTAQMLRAESAAYAKLARSPTRIT